MVRTKTTTGAIRLEEIERFMSQHFVEVFGTMLSIEASLSAKTAPNYSGQRVTGSVGFAGEKINGAVYVHFSEALARRAAANILGIPREEIAGHAEVNDVIGEVANMVTGGLKSWLCDSGAPCAMSTPAIIRGASFQIETAAEVERLLLIFHCGDETVALEIHIKLN